MHKHHHGFRGQHEEGYQPGNFGQRGRGFGEILAERWSHRFERPRLTDVAGDENDFGRGENMFDNGDGWRGGPHGRGRHWFGFGRGHGRSERPLEQGDLRWLVLDLIATQPRHGYEIIKAIEEMLNGNYTPSPGVIYPTLTYLEETGLISSEAQASKKLYTVTDEGRAAVQANASSIQAVRDRIGAARNRFGGPPAPEIVRAMNNLRAAIQVRLSKGELTPESLTTFTTALDRAASEIEKA